MLILLFNQFHPMNLIYFEELLYFKYYLLYIFMGISNILLFLYHLHLFISSYACRYLIVLQQNYGLIISTADNLVIKCSKYSHHILLQLTVILYLILYRIEYSMPYFDLMGLSLFNIVYNK